MNKSLLPIATQGQQPRGKKSANAERKARIAAGDVAAKSIFQHKDTVGLKEEIKRLKDELQKSMKEVNSQGKKLNSQGKKLNSQGKNYSNQSKTQYVQLIAYMKICTDGHMCFVDLS